MFGKNLYYLQHTSLSLCYKSLKKVSTYALCLDIRCHSTVIRKNYTMLLSAKTSFNGLPKVTIDAPLAGLFSEVMKSVVFEQPGLVFLSKFSFEQAIAHLFLLLL